MSVLRSLAASSVVIIFTFTPFYVHVRLLYLILTYGFKIVNLTNEYVILIVANYVLVRVDRKRK